MNPSPSRPLAVVTGASSGIGYELAKVFAQDGFDLVMTAEDDELSTAAERVRAIGAEVEAVQADLATAEGVDELADGVTNRGRPVDALVLNAGIGRGGRFVDTPLEDHLRTVDLNVRSVVHLAGRLVPAMVNRASGRVLITSSIASAMPGTYQAIYNASKSFDQAFALALREELKGTGVTLTSLMPGPTETEFFRRAGMLDTRIGAGGKDSAGAVARQGYEALMAGRERAVAASLSTKAMGYGSRFVPDVVKAKMHAVMSKPGSAR